MLYIGVTIKDVTHIYNIYPIYIYIQILRMMYISRKTGCFMREQTSSTTEALAKESGVRMIAMFDNEEVRQGT